MSQEGQLKCEFVVLTSLLDPAHRKPIPVAVVARELSAGDTRKLILHTVAHLRTGADERRLGYLHELFDSWRGVAGCQLDRLFDEIRELSSDLLRADRSGVCLLEDLAGVVEQALGTSGLAESADPTRSRPAV